MAGEITYSLDAEGNLRHVNSRWLSLLGYSSRNVIGSSLAGFVHIDNLNEIGDAFRMMSRNKASELNLRYSIKTKKGHYLTFDSKWSILYDRKKKFAGIIGHASEISTGSIDKAELRRFLMEHDDSPDIIYAVDLDGNILYINKNWLKHMKYTKKSVIGSTLAEHIHADDHGQISRKFKEVISKGKKRKLKYRIKDKHGRHKIHSSTWEPLKDKYGRNVGIIGVAKHIATEKRGDIGIGTLIIFISMILVASIAGGVLVRSSVTLQSKALIAGDKASTHAATSLRTVSLSATNGSDHHVEYFEQRLMLGASEPVNIMQAVINIETYDSSADLVYGSGPCVRDDTMSANGSSGFYTNGSTGIFTMETLVTGGDNEEGYLLEGNMVKLCYEAPRPIEEGERIKIRILPKIGNVELIDTILPNIITTEKVQIY